MDSHIEQKRCSKCSKNEKIPHKVSDTMVICSSCGKTSVKWSKVIIHAVTHARRYKTEYKEAPTLRAIYYTLIGIEVIPDKKSAYKGLSRALSDARLDGTFPWNLMARARGHPQVVR